jgi:integration host factor subunit beta
MTKRELINGLKEKADISAKEAASVVDSFFNQMSDALAAGDRVEIRGLCSFYVKEYESYQGRNPKTGVQVTVPAKKLPFFKCGQELKKRVDLSSS